MERCVELEWLDELPVDHPGAEGSRRDLQRLNAWMGNARIIARHLRRIFRAQKPASLVELGAGDGRFMLRVARHLAPQWSGTRVLLVDKQPVPVGEIRSGFTRLGWAVETLQEDVLAWITRVASHAHAAIIANLFLHHFSETQLTQLFAEIAKRAPAFVAVEPRRSHWTLAASRLVGLIGCNHVTQHDAPASVRAGFNGIELSALWPAGGGWRLQERPAGLFSHLFVAERLPCS
jgi:hypothetical protein